MMYDNKMAIAIKTNGKVLRELKDTVYLPFGCEYSIFIKNLNGVRASVSIDIDGTNVGDGKQFIVPANGEIEITRFIKNGNLSAGNRFKFIERSAAVEQHRGIGVLDGLIRVQFQYEKVIPQYVPPVPVYVSYPVFVPYSTQPHWLVDPYRVRCGSSTEGGSSVSPTLSAAYYAASISGSLQGAAIGGSTLMNTTTIGTAQASINNITTNSIVVNDAGITVPGSVSDQKFDTAIWFPLEDQKHVMVVKLLGETNAGFVVQVPVTVKSKPKCTTCGKVNKATSKFCTECGTCLELVA